MASWLQYKFVSLMHHFAYWQSVADRISDEANIHCAARKNLEHRETCFQLCALWVFFSRGGQDLFQDEPGTSLTQCAFD